MRGLGQRFAADALQIRMRSWNCFLQGIGRHMLAPRRQRTTGVRRHLQRNQPKSARESKSTQHGLQPTATAEPLRAAKRCSAAAVAANRRASIAEPTTPVAGQQQSAWATATPVAATTSRWQCSWKSTSRWWRQVPTRGLHTRPAGLQEILSLRKFWQWTVSTVRFQLR